jgi:hypothetical protein
MEIHDRDTAWSRMYQRLRQQPVFFRYMHGVEVKPNLEI